ncbi:hypothetical protein TFLX_00292 [Thermoflexales bacterium]|nr:hypothetical protein TFLX_00292 [Thermoflexales bacterium]
MTYFSRCWLAIALGTVVTLGVCTLLTSSARLPVAASTTNGSLRFIDGAGLPLSNATLRVLCFSAPNAAFPLADVPVTTNAGGQPVNNLPIGCTHLATLQLLHTQPSGKIDHGPAYWVYATSWSPVSPTLLPVTDNVTISIGNPLVLFNMVVSLEWQPAPTSTFAADLTTGLRSASAYLYDLTEGQLAIGPVSIHAGGRYWDAADVRVRAANDYRPSARVGGIISATRPYTTASITGTVYRSGEVLLGRYWDGADAFRSIAGAWSQANAYRTLIHEWGHYALFLYDEYQDLDLDGRVETYCTCADLPLVTAASNPAICGGVTSDFAASAMSLHYTATELWHSGTPSVCLNTDQWRVHAAPDWQTLQNWSHLQGLSPEWLHVPANLTAGPALGFTQHLFGRTPGRQVYLPLITRGGTASPTALLFEPTISVTSSGLFTAGQLAALYPQIYVTTSASSRLVHQGTTYGTRINGGLGSIELLGVQPADRAWVFLDRYAAAGSVGARYHGVHDLSPAANQTIQLMTDTWRSSLDVAYDMTGSALTTLTVTLTSLDAITVTPSAQLCVPDAAIGCSSAWRKSMQARGSITWTTVFTASIGDELPHYGLLHVQAGSTRELMRWYLAAGGVGPAHIDGNAPLRDGLVMVDAAQPIVGSRNQVIVMPAAEYAAITASLPVTIQGLVGTPLDIDVLLPAGPVKRSEGRSASVSLVFTLFYSQDTIDRLGLREDQLHILHFDRQTQAWQMVPSSGRSETLNWIASAPIGEAGIFAIGWAADPPHANFIANPLAGPAPLTVFFFNESSGDYTASLWDFGDTVGSTLLNPTHTYTLPGFYTVTLTVSGPGGSDVLVRLELIFVQGTR